MKKLIALSTLLFVPGAPLTAGIFTNNTDEENLTFQIYVTGQKNYDIKKFVPSRKSVSFSFKQQLQEMKEDLKQIQLKGGSMSFGVAIKDFNDLCSLPHYSSEPHGFIDSPENIDDWIENTSLTLKTENGEYYIN